MSHIFFFNQQPIPLTSEVGGKANSLIRMTQAGYQVPNGFVCAAVFFDSWTDQIKNTAAWSRLQTALSQGLSITENTAEITKIIQTLELNNEQSQAIDNALSTLTEDALYAVRSSSPEEDLVGASFAGIYETQLGVTKKSLEQSIRSVFSSAFDERVFVYKKIKGFALDEVKIAVIVMEQIRSEIAGVGFSVNPINNDYDEATINANYGLGESVVGGMVSPDYFVINKVDNAIISKELGRKHKSVFIDDTVDNSDGGTREQQNQQLNQFSLTDPQITEIGKMIIAVEKLYGLPVDIEWAYANNQLYMIQARPYHHSYSTARINADRARSKTNALL